MRSDNREWRSMRSNKSVYPCHISLPVPSPVSHISWYFLCSTIWCVIDRFVDIGGIVELLNFSFLVKIIQILPLVNKISNKKKEHILIKKIIILQTTSLSIKVGIRCLEIEHNNWSFLANISMEICVVKGLLSVVCLDQYWGHCFFSFITYYCPVTVRSKPLFFLMFALSIEILNTTTIVSHCKMT